MRTTLTLDEDVAAKLKAESRKTGRPFRVRARAMGLRPGINIDKVSALLDELEGPEHK